MPDKSTALRELLARARLNPRNFARAINEELERTGQDSFRIDLTSPYQWVRHGYRPYDPLPAIAAAVLSQCLDETLTADDLWPGRPWTPSVAPIPAVADIDAGVSIEQILTSLAALAAHGSDVHLHITPATGPDLAASVLAGLNSTLEWTQPHRGRERVLPAQVQLIHAHVTQLRRLDDQLGGGALNLRYLTGELRTILDLAASAACEEEKVRRDLLVIVSDLAQLVGWVHFDACHYGVAQRYIRLSERVAHAIGDVGRAANAIGMLSYISAFAGHGHDAVYIAEAAQEHCTDDPVLRARIAGRVATAAAAAGDQTRFRRASEQARLLLEAATEVPSYLYYLEPAQLAAERGQGLVALGERRTVHRKQLLSEAITLLTPISAEGARPHFPRSALLHGAVLARACLLLEEVELAVDAGRAALTRLDQVQSLRGWNQLRQLRPLYHRYRTVRAVADFLRDFDRALSQT
ncbi:hypothetical protein [Nonomuraea sp. KM90]|uniref:hypothetical protein n=1 Tax=Nonomuraea sp. KM90 TaxID=3457428 RepID=UPI003FCC458C